MRPCAASRRAHQRDHHQEAPGQRDGGALVRGLEAGGPQGGGQRAPARPPVALGRGAAGAEPLDHAQPPDHVGRGGRGLRGDLLLGARPARERAPEQGREREQRRQAGEHQQAERRRDAQQQDRREHDHADRRDPEPEHLVQVADARRVRGRQAQQGPRRPVGCPARVQDAARQGQAQVVLGSERGALGDPVAEAERHGEHGEEGRQDDQPADQRAAVAALDRMVDRGAHHHRHQRLGRLVQGQQQRAGGERPAPSPDREAQDAPGRRVGIDKGQSSGNLSRRRGRVNVVRRDPRPRPRR